MTSPPSMPSFWQRLRKQLPILLFLPDMGILCGGLLLGYQIRFGRWFQGSPPDEMMGALLVLGLFLVALASSGIYTTSPDRMRLREFYRVGSHLLGAWGLSLVLTLTLRPSLLSVAIVLGLVALVGMLGLRALLQGLMQRSRSSSHQPSPEPESPSLQLNDLLPRDSIDIERPSLRDYLSSQSILLTGAGGSIGTELCKQILSLNPFQLVMVDVSEHNLYRLKTTLRSTGYEGDLEWCIADVRDKTVMNGLMDKERPDVVLHAAAYKHVPLLERHPAEAFRNNTMATLHLLRLCERHDVDQFVFVSTDKAVQPTSVLGATKRLAEWYVRSASSPMRRKIVRFGNVFGTQGSVVPRFEQKLAAGEPLPITHPDMERYFMTAEEACSLILQTLLVETCPIYTFKMGNPVRIEWLAERFIEHWYPDVDPKTMIDYVGRRPGEKLSEQLIRPEETVHRTDHPNILGLDGPVPYTRQELESHFEQLQALCRPAQASHAQRRHWLLNEQPASLSSRSNRNSTFDL